MPVVQQLLTLSFVILEVLFVNNNIVQVHATPGVKKNETTKKLLKYNNQNGLWATSWQFWEKIAVPFGVLFSKKTKTSEWLTTTGKEWNKKVYKRNKYQIWQTTLNNLDSFGWKHFRQQKLFKKKQNLLPVTWFMSWRRASETKVHQNSAQREVFSYNSIHFLKCRRKTFFTPNSQHHHLIASIE